MLITDQRAMNQEMTETEAEAFFRATEADSEGGVAVSDGGGGTGGGRDGERPC